ncbi:hypothetical protein [Sporolactobacillus sp. KGMB 08714]|uniref:hypothetical protein n=1 Tax=Sporolactobacillus sp. KGMB 08714 TaxID=3064704 RepID=UPI002FBEAB15
MTLRKLFDAKKAHKEIDEGKSSSNLPGLSPELARKMKAFMKKKQLVKGVGANDGATAGICRREDH